MAKDEQIRFENAYNLAKNPYICAKEMTIQGTGETVFVVWDNETKRPYYLYTTHKFTNRNEAEAHARRLNRGRIIEKRYTLKTREIDGAIYYYLFDANNPNTKQTPAAFYSSKDDALIMQRFNINEAKKLYL